ncbi:MAG: bifunctional biotin--[acetyl-CoA-carboxylase] synthetase/biotin operon repressor, partial [Chloroflexota bacterium]|nr:bifunctional biotin--[acetyl-CoA-carboxylase] synthetase/biotin operon repressor [Chloroflexota bacterium]
INVHQLEEDFPAELRATATSLVSVHRAVDRLALLARVTAELDRLEDAAAIAPARAEWRERSSLRDADVVVTVPGRSPVFGIATGIDDDGALLLRTAQGVERVVAGDVRRA